MPGLVDAHGDQHRAVDDASAVTDLFVASVENQVMEAPQRTSAPGLELLVEQLRGSRHLGRADVQAAELLGDLHDPASRDALDVHLGDGELQRALGAHATLEGLRVEAFAFDAPDLRDREIELAHPGLDPLGLEAVGIASAVVTP